MAPRMERMIGFFLLIISLLILLYDSRLFTGPFSFTPRSWVLFGIIAAGSIGLIVHSTRRKHKSQRK